MTVADLSKELRFVARFDYFVALVCVCVLSGREVESVESSCTEMEVVTEALRSLPDHFDEGKNRGSPVRRTDSPSKKKGAAVIELP